MELTIKVLKPETETIQVMFPVAFHQLNTYNVNIYTIFTSETSGYEIYLSESGRQTDLWVIPESSIIDKIKKCYEYHNIINVADFLSALSELEDRVALAKTKIFKEL